jgi:PEP-CTERM motif
MKTLSTLVAALSCAGFTLSAQAAQDPAYDLLPSFTGTPSAGLDLIEADVSFDSGSNSFRVQARTLGPLADAPSGALVFGFHRGGSANQPFGSIGFGDIAFNATALLRSDGTGNVGSTAIQVQLQGDTVSAVLPASLLPAQGFAPQDFTWALWSVDLAVTGLPRNADFIATHNLNVSVVPEPASLTLLLAGIAAIGVSVRGRRLAQPA